MKICIDAGHGGHDPGATNIGFKEKDFALEIALDLNKTLKTALPEAEIIMTRTDDTFLFLSQRCKIANENNCDIFTSIHLNSSINKEANGIETLVYKNTGETGKLAELVQKTLCANLHTKDRGIKEYPDLAVLNGTKMPALLIEAGFISNTEELNKLNTEAYRHKISLAIVAAIKKYLGVGSKMPEIKDAKDAIELLCEEDIINSPEYWDKAVDVVKHLDTLIIKFANYIQEH